MFIFRLWKRIHQPFIVLFYSSTLLLLTSVSVTRGTKVSAEDPSLSPSSFMTDKLSNLWAEELKSRFDGKVIVDDDKSPEGHPEMRVDQVMDEDTFITIPVIPQLPFCNGKSSSGGRGQGPPPTTSSAPDGLWGLNQNDTAGDATSASGEDSDEIVLSNHGQTEKKIVVATLDGNVSILDNTGKILWAFSTGHLFSSTISSLQLNDRGKYIKLIPSLTGGLYKYDGESLQAMPLNADSLLKKSFKLSQDVVIAGGKELRTFGIDVESGDVKYECGMDGCKTPLTPDISSREDSSGVVLVIKKQLQTVRAIDSLTGIERWNFSVGTHELALAGVTEGCYEPAEDPTGTGEEPTHLFRMVIPEGLILGADAENKAVWQHKFESPISQAWILENGHLQILDPIKNAPLQAESPTLYVGIHKQQLYVQESHKMAKELREIFEIEDASINEFTLEPLKIGWKPSAIAPTTESVVADVNNEQTALAPLYLTPFFIYDRDQIRRPALEGPPNASDNICLEDDEDVEEVNGNHDVDNEVLLGLATLWFWWKEVLGISIITAIILNILLMRPMAHYIRRQAIEDVMYHVNAFLRRRREEVLALPAPPPRASSSSDSLEVPNSLRTRTVSNSSNHSSVEDQVVPFSSQYLREFEPIQCLGRGAFGIVFEAKKRIDDRTYAVKRIELPNREKSRDRVMREVKALAKLDHKNIVRYFNAWIESPPPGWLERNDPLYNSRNVISPSPTYDNSDVFGGSGDYSSIPSYITHRKKDYSEIFVPDKTPVEDGDDSFIVFETGSSVQASEVTTDSGLWTHVGKGKGRHSPIEETGEWSDDENEKGRLLPQTLHEVSIIPSPEMSNSKFFRRPTTLDIPSSTENSGTCLLNTAYEHNPLSIMYLYIQQELCQKRTLQDWLRNEKSRKLRQVLKMFSQIVEAVEYIHSHKLIHRDLKPGNIFLAGGNGLNDEDMTVKIGDFGLATTLVENELNDDFGPLTRVDIDKGPANAKLTGQVGTQLYMSPEQFQKRVYDHKVDIYSLGLIFFELLVPFSTDMERHNELIKVRNFQFPNSFKTSHPDQYGLIQSMVSHDPDLRPDASDIKLSLTSQLQSIPSVESNPIRSKSYPSHLTSGDSSKKAHRLRDGTDHRRSRHIFKTHSAM